MKEKLYTIPVNEGFEKDCECPICYMVKTLEDNAIDFTMGPSYMEDDVREATSRLGFCEKHIQRLYKHQNRLGLALILVSHMDKIIKDTKRLSSSKISTASFFKKKNDRSELASYYDKLDNSCYICENINNTLERYIATIFHLYHHDKSFRDKFKASKGFCAEHYKILYEDSTRYLSGTEQAEFVEILNRLYLDHMERVRDDLSWFIDKFDYRYADEPWKNSKDALPRIIEKINSINPLD